MGKLQMSVDEIVKLAAKTAVEEYKRSVEQAQKDFKDKRVRNTKKLLENYHKLKAHVDCVEDTIEDITHDMFMTQHYFGEMVIPSILKSKQHTLGLIRFLDHMLIFYKIKCEHGTPEQQRRYQVLELHYIQEPALSVLKIANKLNIAERTVYDDLKLAREELAVYLFGVDVIELKTVV